MPQRRTSLGEKNALSINTGWGFRGLLGVFKVNIGEKSY